MIFKRPPFVIGDRVVYDCPLRGVPMRGEVLRVLRLTEACIVYFPATGASLLISYGYLRTCPVRLASCRPRSPAEGGAA